MKKMNLTRSLLAACSIVALSAVMYGCGGGGGDPAPVDETDMETRPAPEPMDVANPDGLMYLSNDMMPSAGELMIPAGGSSTSGGVTYSCAAGGDDCTVTIADDGSATSLGGMVTASLTTEAQDDVDEAKTSAMLMARDRVIGESVALQGSNIVTLGTAPAPGLDMADFTVSRAPNGDAEVKVTGFSPGEMAAPTAGDFAGFHLVQENRHDTGLLFVYTDIDAPMRAPFYDVDTDGDGDVNPDSGVYGGQPLRQYE